MTLSSSPSNPDFFVREVQLLLRERNSVRRDAIVPGGVTDECSPAATNVQKAFALLELQLATDHVELIELCLLQRCIPRAKVSAGIHHVRIEEQLVEVVAQVVVKTE